MNRGGHRGVLGLRPKCRQNSELCKWDGCLVRTGARGYVCRAFAVFSMPFLRFIPETTNVDFVGWRYYAFALDGVLTLVALVSIVVQGFNLGIDFTGGVLMEVKSAQVIDIGKMRSDVDGLGFKEVRLQYFGGGECDTPANSCVLIRVQPNATQVGETVANRIKDKLGSAYTFRRNEVVGPQVSHELFNDGVLATVLAIVFISLYVAF